jgi:DNA-directed RNA polymerase subunit H (RpoH/RPB5)
MEEKALETLRTMLGRRGLETKTDRVIVHGHEADRANLYTIGNVLVIFSQKDNGLMVRDINGFLSFANSNDYTNGIILVALAPPSESVLKHIKSLAKERVQFFHIRQLQFDITTHRMAMPHRILKEDEQNAVFKKYNVTKPSEQLPLIDSQDTMTKWIGAIPGDILEITRHSDVAGPQLYYRYVVPDVNVA